ncbi:unnamed protein product [Ectocarpus sp. 12 AP-2014]
MYVLGSNTKAGKHGWRAPPNGGSCRQESRGTLPYRDSSTRTGANILVTLHQYRHVMRNTVSCCTNSPTCLVNTSISFFFDRQPTYVVHASFQKKESADESPTPEVMVLQYSTLLERVISPL